MIIITNNIVRLPVGEHTVKIAFLRARSSRLRSRAKLCNPSASFSLLRRRVSFTCSSSASSFFLRRNPSFNRMTTRANGRTPLSNGAMRRYVTGVLGNQ